MPMPPQTYKKAMEPEIRVVIPEHPHRKKYHIFQQLENDKERHALENWRWFEDDRPRLESSISKKIGRPEEKLMMDMGFLHRLKMENMQVVDSVKTIEDRVRGDLWQMSLRNNWEKSAEIGGLHGVPEVFPNGQYNKEIVRIGNSDREYPGVEYFKDSSRRHLLRRSQWGEFEWFVQSIVDGLAKANPHMPQYGGLKVVGKAIKPSDHQTPKANEEKTEDAAMEQEAQEALRILEDSPPWLEKPERPVGPAASLNRNHLLFCCRPGDIDQRSVIVKNRGTTAVFYSWERRPVEPLVLPARKKEGWRLFTVMRGTGSLLPGHARKFVFKYSSREVGTHMEKWVCRIYPRLANPVEPVDLKGVTMFDDRLRKWRSALTTALEYREMVSGIKEAFTDIQDTAAKLCRPTAELREHDYIYSKAAFDFIRNNLTLQPPVYFAPTVFKEFEKLGRTVDAAAPPPPPVDPVVVSPSATGTSRPRRKSSRKKSKKESAVSPQDAGEVPTKKSRKKSKKVSGADESEPNLSDEEESLKKSRRKSKVVSGADDGEPKAADEKVSPKKSRRKSKVVSGAENAEANMAEGEASLKKGRRKSKVVSGADEAEPTTTNGELAPKRSSRRSRISAADVSAQAGTSPPERDAIATDPSASAAPALSAAGWAGSVSSIWQAIKTVPDKKQRSAFKAQFRELMEIATIPPHQTSLLLVAIYRSLYEISGDMERVLETVTEESGRPVVEQLLKSYYAQIDAEQSAADAAELLKEEEEGGDLTWPFKDDESEDDWLPEEKKKELKRKQSNEMLDYVMRWVHILTEARCILRYGFNGCEEQIVRDQSDIATMIDHHIREYSEQGCEEDSAWRVFDLERKKQVLKEEYANLPSCQLPNCPNCVPLKKVL